MNIPGVKGIGLLLVLSLTFSLILAQEKEFTIVPDTVGIGLQKNYDIVDFESSDALRCVPYDLGNPWSTDVTGWLEIEGDLEQYFVENQPEKVFVPSGTFRYNSSCCLLPIKICFELPYVLETTAFEGTIRSAFVRGDQQATSGTGSATGSSVAYSLTINVHPPSKIELKAGETKCIDILDIGEKCFSAPMFVLFDKTVDGTIEGLPVKFVYSNNLWLVIVLAVIIGGAAYYYYKKTKKTPAKSKNK